MHIDRQYLTQRADQPKGRDLCVALDRARRWVFIPLQGTKSARAVRTLLAALAKACLERAERVGGQSPFVHALAKEPDMLIGMRDNGAQPAQLDLLQALLG